MYTLGLDIGSTTSKCVLLKDGREVIASALICAGIGTKGAQQVVDEVWKKNQRAQEGAVAMAVTGYGRNIWQGDAFKVSELTCHALGAHLVFPESRTIIDIGGQDSKAILLDDTGRMVSFQMNDKCAAGTGRFLEVMTRVLQLDFKEFDAEALVATKPVAISNTCTVFAESEVISQLAAGERIDDVAAGIAESIATRAASQAKRLGVREKVCMAGGVSQSKAIREAMERVLNTEILYSDFAQYLGALGAAIYAYEKQASK
jgi:predicted CoA-substrate-specific enzyme activase